MPGRERAATLQTEAGFTLIEVMVALAVFSLAVLALLNVAGENTRTAGVAETRILAGVVAENRAVEIATAPRAPPAGRSEGAEAAGGRLWRWTRRVSATDDPALLRVDISVTPDGAMRQAAALTVFRSQP